MEEIELLVFSYIPSERFPEFAQSMEKRGLTVRGSASVLSTPPSAPLQWWDYPNFTTEFFEASKLRKALEQEDSPQFKLLTPLGIHGVLVNPVPDHYPFTYVLGLHFAIARSGEEAISLENLTRATQEAKRLSACLAKEALYRPVFWFIPIAPEEAKGLTGSVNRVVSPSGTPVGVERGFPDTSYAVYGTKPSLEDLHVSNLALVAVVAHHVERGVRGELSRLAEQVETEIKAVEKALISEPASVRQLEKSISELQKIERNLSPLVDQAYRIRDRLIRIKGLVSRVREKCGTLTHNGLFDVICDDAMTVIDAEMNSKLQQIENRTRLVADRINDLATVLGNKNSRTLQSIGYLLQSTGVAFIVFQVLEKTLLGPSSVPDPSIRFLWLVIAAILSGAATFGVIRNILG